MSDPKDFMARPDDDELAKLRAENEQLKAEVEKLKKTIDRQHRIIRTHLGPDNM